MLSVGTQDAVGGHDVTFLKCTASGGHDVTFLKCTASGGHDVTFLKCTASGHSLMELRYIVTLIIIMCCKENPFMCRQLKRLTLYVVKYFLCRYSANGEGITLF